MSGFTPIQNINCNSVTTTQLIVKEIIAEDNVVIMAEGAFLTGENTAVVSASNGLALLRSVAGDVQVSSDTGVVSIVAGNDINLTATNDISAICRDFTIISTGPVAINADTAGADGIQLTAGTAGITWGSKGSVTQITSLTTGVTVNAPTGIITTVTATTAAVSSNAFTVTNNRCFSTSHIFAMIDDYTGTFATNGIPLLAVDTIVDGSFQIIVSNAHNANALNGILRIVFLII